MLRVVLILLAVNLANAEESDELIIIGGQDTTIEEHPYQVSIQYLQDHRCGGAIVTKKHVMTAAHCSPRKNSNTNRITVKAGITDIHESGISYAVSGFISSPKFNRETLDSDIGFYIVRDAIQYNPKVQAIALAERNGQPNDGDMLTITGWRLEEDDRDKVDHKLQKLLIPVLRRYYCELALNASRTFKFTDNMFCAGGAVGKLPEMGDYGGPAVDQSKKLVGIMSWGLQPSDPTQPFASPIVFTDLRKPLVRDFIDRVLNGTI